MKSRVSSPSSPKRPMKTYLIENKAERYGSEAPPKFYVEVPEDWEVRFEPAFVPAALPTRGQPHNCQNYELSLKFFEGDKLVATFDNVRAWRRTDINVTKEIQTEKGTISYRVDENERQREEIVTRDRKLIAG